MHMPNSSYSPRLVIAAPWLALLVVGCGVPIEKSDTPEQSAATIAVFAPNSAEPCNSVLPFPSDLAKDPNTGLLKIPFCPDDTPTTTATKHGLRTLDGFSLSTPIYTKFSRPITQASAEAGVLLVNLASGAMVSFTPILQNDGHQLLLLPATSLESSTQYMALVLSAVQDTDGNPVVSDQIFTFAKSKTPLVDEQGYSLYAALADADANSLEALRQGLAPMFAGIEQTIEIDRSDVAVAWTFTTQSVQAPMGQLMAAAIMLGAPSVSHSTVGLAASHPLLLAAGIPTDNLCHVHSGTMSLPNFVSAAGTLNPEGPSSTVVDYLFITPKPDNPGDCNDPWAGLSDEARILLFSHGLGRCKNDALALANTVAGAGYAVLSLDGPRAGGRVVGNLGDQDLDGCADQPSTPEILGLSGQVNPFGVRDQLRQWAIELALAAKVAKSAPWQLVGAAAPDMPEPARVALFGHSWGGMAAALTAYISTDIDALALNSAPAEMGSVFASSIRASIVAELHGAGVDPSTAPGDAILATRLAEAVSTFRWILDPADPLHFAAHWPAELPSLMQVVRATSEANTDTPLHPASGQSALSSIKNEAAAVTYTMTYDPGDGSEEPICEAAAVGAILQPCAAAGPAYVPALQKLAAMRTQLVYFLLTDTVCGGSATACP